jgi:FkbM family methyltransferase
MSFKSNLVRYLDDAAPALLGNARYHLHVSWRGDIVFPKITSVLFERLNSKAATAIDVGANVGIFTRYLSRHFSRVVSVEPVPYLADRLRRSALSNCSIVGKALGNAEGELTLRIPVNAAGREMPALSTASSNNSLSFIDSAGHVERVVPVTRLDIITADITNLAFVKIDVEGFEDSVLSGAGAMLEKQRPVIQMEIGQAHNPNYLQTVATLETAGYALFALQNDGLHSNALDFIQAQPTHVSKDEESNPHGCWDYIIIPKERVEHIASELIVR